MANILILGGGGREHAIADSLAKCEQVECVFVSPGNAGTARSASSKMNNLAPMDDHSMIIEVCRSLEIDLVVVGPEGPLANGVVDALSAADIQAFGPTKKAARIESSKVWAKNFMTRHAIPTAEYRTFRQSDSEEDIGLFIDRVEWNSFAVKASGLAYGKGVRVERGKDAAKEAVSCLRENSSPQMREAAKELIVEELIEGSEVSIMAFTDGHSVAMMPPIRDYKRRFAGEEGPNTGGMGAYGPCSVITEDQLKNIEENIMMKAVNGLAVEGCPFTGVLYAGLMMTPKGPRVLEFNCRFGDPEAQVLCLLLRSNLYQILKACVKGRLHEVEILFEPTLSAVAINVVINSYPGEISQGIGLPILGLDKLDEKEVTVFYAGAKRGSDDILETTGGRVLSICCSNDSLEWAIGVAVKSASLIGFGGASDQCCASYRGDIGFNAILERARLRGARMTYADAGVNLRKAETLVTQMKEWARGSRRPGVKGDLGSFGGLFCLSEEIFKNPILVSGTDGVGTKIKIAQAMNNHSTIGEDLVAMCVNDVLMHGAEPLYFLDYLATGKLEETIVSEIIKSVAKGCSFANCSLIGGETAELPGVYGIGECDLAGFAVGAVEKEDLLPRTSEMKAGDVLIGISSSGIHSNGYSLVRKIVENLDLHYDQLAPFSKTKTLGEILLTPTYIYTPLVKVMRQNLILGAAHITGGGLALNIMRIVPQHLAVKIDREWPIPSVFAWLTALGVPLKEMLSTFNLGIGVVLIVKAKDALSALESLQSCFQEIRVDHFPEYLPVDGEIKPYSSWIIGSLISEKESRSPFDVQKIEEHLDKRACLAVHCHPDCFPRRPRRRVAVLISGTGTNLQAILDHARNGFSEVEVVLVISNRENAAGLQRAQRVNVRTKVIKHNDFPSREKFEDEINLALMDFKVEIVVLAGFMRILTGGFVRKWRGKMINLHPSLLPSFKGGDALEQALRAGVTLTGCTAHFVEEEVDAGAIICQEAVPVLPTDDLLTLRERVQAKEHHLLPRALELVARGKAVLDEAGSCIRRS